MKKRLVTVLLAMTLTASLLSACGDDKAAETTTETATEEVAEEPAAEEASGDVQEIKFMIWDDLEASEDLITKGYKESVDRFNKDFEGKYHCTPITTNLEEYYDKLNALVAAGETPDVFIASPGANLNDYATTGVAAKLDDYLNADGWKQTFTSDAVFAGGTYGDDGGDGPGDESK